jgi:hypothetical protein
MKPTCDNLEGPNWRKKKRKKKRIRGQKLKIKNNFFFLGKILGFRGYEKYIEISSNLLDLQAHCEKPVWNLHVQINFRLSDYKNIKKSLLVKTSMTLLLLWATIFILFLLSRYCDLLFLCMSQLILILILI